MAPDLIRDSFVGLVFNKLSQGKLFPYTEERTDFVVPQRYLQQPPLLRAQSIALGNKDDLIYDSTLEISEKEARSRSSTSNQDLSIQKSDLSSSLDLEQQPHFYDADDEKSNQITPYKSRDSLAIPDNSKSTDHGQYIVVDWYSDDDQDNPQNWSNFKKVWVVFTMAFLTVTLYTGSSIFTPGSAQMMAELNTSRVKATLPLTTFIMGYAVGPMVLSPMSEHPPLGRNLIYVFSLAIFCILQVPTALAHNIETIAGLRLLAGIAASPVLSTSGATIGDVLSPERLTFGLVSWAIGACSGPTCGPLIGGVLALKVGWRWTFWFMCIFSGASLAAMCFLVPETNHATILHKRAARLRKRTGNQAIRSPFEVQEVMTFRELVVDTLWRPIFISFCEPIVLSLNIYIGFVYIIINSWFESLPIVFEQFYGFNLVESGCVYISNIVGAIIGGILYLCIVTYLRRTVTPENDNIERLLIPSLIGTFFLPISIFLFSWGSSSYTNWMAPTASLAIFQVGGVFIFQSIFAYYGKGFHRYLASVYAGNCLVRSLLASIFPLFTYPMYTNLAMKNFPVAKAGSIWGCIGIALIAIPFTIYHFGVRLRGRSKYAN